MRPLLGPPKFPPRPGLPGSAEKPKEAMCCSWQLRADQHCRERPGLAQRSLSAHTQTGTPTAEAGPGYLYQLYYTSHIISCFKDVLMII